MIWDLIEESQFDKHFSHPQLTITRLLLDQNIITQLKNQNPKLLTYLNNHKEEFITELIEYTIIMPELSDGSDRCFKLPYISSELLAIDSELIYVQFFKEGVPQQENKFWKQLLCFLDSPAAQNEILMGYFEKVINNLYNGNKAKTARIISIQLQKFQKLLINGSIGDILKKCIILFTTPQGQVLAERQKILSKVIEHFSQTSNEQERQICSDILIDVVNKFQAFSSGENLLFQLLSNQNLNKIYKVIHSIAINTFLVNLLKKSQQRIVNEKDQSVKILTIPQNHLSSISNHIELQVVQLQRLLSTQQYIMNQNKAMVRKSNKKIYSILSLVSLAIQEGQYNFISCLFVNNLWKLLILYPYNNILHVSILKIFTNIFKSSKRQLIDIFLKQFKAYMLELQKHNFQMFRPFLYSIWKETLTSELPKGSQQINQKYAKFVEQRLQPLTKYEINKKKGLTSTQIQNKLIVDEQDKQNSQNLSNSDVQEYVPPSYRLEPQVISIEKPVQEIKTTTQFDFFSKWEDQKPIEENKQVKQDLFDDFTNFF